MAKIQRTISTVLPPYQRDRNQWRRKILKLVLRARKQPWIDYDQEDRFEVVVLLYLKKGKRHTIHDVDNRLKDILDALQGRFGGPKSIRGKSRLIHNDRQVSRVVMEKQVIPKSLGDGAGGRLLIAHTNHGDGHYRVSKAISSGSGARFVRNPCRQTRPKVLYRLLTHQSASSESAAIYFAGRAQGRTES